MTKGFQPITPAQAKRAVLWFSDLFGLGGWAVTLYVTDTQPVWAPGEVILGCCLPLRTRKRVKLWVSNGMAERENEDPLENLFHECEHWLWSDIGITNDEGGPAEYVWNQLAKTLAFAFRHKMRPTG